MMGVESVVDTCHIVDMVKKPKLGSDIDQVAKAGVDLATMDEIELRALRKRIKDRRADVCRPPKASPIGYRKRR